MYNAYEYYKTKLTDSITLASGDETADEIEHSLELIADEMMNDETLDDATYGTLTHLYIVLVSGIRALNGTR